MGGLIGWSINIRNNMRLNNMFGKGLIAKCSLVLAFTALFSIFMFQGWYGPKKAEAAITRQADFTQQYASTAYPAGAVNASYAIADGSNRILVVAITSTRNAAGTHTVSVTYGGQALTLAAGDAGTSALQHSYLYYLNDAGIGSASSGKSLNVTITGGTAVYTYVYAAVYAGVDQGTPLSDTKTASDSTTTTSTVVAYSPALAINANEQAVEVVNLIRSATGSTVRSISAWATGWNTTPNVDAYYTTTSTYMPHIYVNEFPIPGSNTTTTSAHTIDSANTYESHSAISMKAAVITTVGNGTNPGNASLCPGGSATMLDSFTIQTSTGTDTVTNVTVTLTPTGAFNNIGLIEITSDLGSIVYGSVTNPAADAVTITTTGFSATTTSTQYKVRITPKIHPNMPVPPGASYAVTGTVTAITSTYAKTYSDTTSATVTIDNLSPNNPTAFSGTPGNPQVSLSWTNPVDVDFSQVIVLRKAGSAVTDTPSEGISYSVGGTIGTSTVACVVITPGATCTDTGLTNGTAYYYKIFAKDSCVNCSSGGTAAGPYTPNVTTVVNGTNPANASLCPGGAATMLDSFTLQTSTGTDTVTAVQVSFAAGTSAGIGFVEITDDAGSTVYGLFTNPADTQNITLTSNITATTASTQYKVRITPRTHANMPVPPGASYAVTGTVTAITSTYAKTYSDTTSATVTIDNLSPNNPTAFSGTPGNAQVSLIWTNPVVGDFSQVVVLRKAGSVVTDTPSEGMSYSAGGTIGTSTVACVVNTPGTTCTDTGLTNGIAYYYKIFAKDSCGNYSSGGTAAGPYTPNVTTVGDGTNPADAPLCPGGAATMLDSFTLQTSTGTDTVTNVTVTLTPTGAFNNIGLIEITNDLGGAVYGSVTNPAADAVTITTPGLSATTTLTQYKVRITPKTHPNMPVPPGASYAVTGTVTAITSTYAKTYSDTTSATVTIDNLSPGNPTGFSGTPGNAQVSLSWTNPVVGDFSQVIILRNTSAITDTPVEGVTYSQGNTIGTSTVRYVGSLQTFTDTGLTNGIAYYYKIFAKDSCGNYSSGGTAAGPYTPNVITMVGDGTNPANAPLCPGGAATILDSFTLQTSTGTDTVTAVQVSFAAGTSAGIGFVEITDDAGSTVYGSFTNPADTQNITLTSNITATTASTQYKVRITPRTHANMPVPPGASYAVTGTVTAITSTYAKTYSDTTSATVTIDNASPSNATWGTITPGDKQITLNWANPADGDFSKVLILRKTSSISDTPVEGTIYSASGTIGTSTVVYVGNGTTFTDTGLTNGTSYYYKIFAYDTCINYATGTQTGPHMPSGPPTLTYPASPYNDGKNPDTGDTTTDFTFKVIYTDGENDPPAAGYPKIYIGDHDGFVSYIMTAEDPGDTNYTDGKIFYFTTKLGAVQDLRFYFEAQASTGNTSIVRLPSNAPTSFSKGPDGYLLYGYNMVGVPKNLGTGLSYSSVLGDDSGGLLCYTWDSAGLDTGPNFNGSWIDCTSDNVQTGKGYYIWSTASNYWRLDEPSGTGNVIAANFDIDLEPYGGWTMISNPYNGIVQLQNIKVVRSSTEYNFSLAVTNGWIGNSIYAYEGPTTGYTFSAYNDTPPATLKPWVGYFIYVKDNIPTALRIYAP